MIDDLLEDIFKGVTYPKKDLLAVANIAINEFEALEFYNKSSKQLKETAIKEFKDGIRNHFYFLEFGKYEHKNVIVDVPAATVDDNDKIIDRFSVKKKTKKLGTKASIRATSEANKLTKLFKKKLNGNDIIFDDKFVSDHAKYCFIRYKEFTEKAKPTKTELLRSFKTWIDGLLTPNFSARKLRNRLTNDVLISFQLPNITSKEISSNLTPLSPYNVKYRTIDL